MRLFLTILLTALIVPLAAHAQAPKQVEVINDPLAVEVVNPAPPSPPVRWQLVGFTSTSYTGDTGVLAFTVACQAEFEAGSRMCTSEEVLNTVTVPTALSGSAWVRPVYQPFNAEEDSTSTVTTRVLDASGRIAGSTVLRGLSCTGWSDGGGTGLSVDGSGRFLTTNNCDDPHPVACCALVP